MVVFSDKDRSYCCSDFASYRNRLLELPTYTTTLFLFCRTLVLWKDLFSKREVGSPLYFSSFFSI